MILLEIYWHMGKTMITMHEGEGPNDYECAGLDLGILKWGGGGGGGVVDHTYNCAYRNGCGCGCTNFSRFFIIHRHVQVCMYQLC